MVVLIGAFVVLGSVLVGFTMAGGHVHALIHPSEFVTIGGATLGGLIIMAPVKVIKDIIKGVVLTIKGSPYGKPTCIELFKLLYAITRMTRSEGVLALDQHLSDPKSSTLFKQYPKISGNHHALDFIVDALSLIVDGQAETEKLAGWLEEDIAVIEKEHHMASGTLARVGDGLPGFGIVAAVLGIVVTMQAIGGPVDEIGEKVGAALVGTFLGILMSYGFVGPIATRMESLGELESLFLRSVSTAVVAINEGANPREVVIRARRVLGTECRPSQAELKQMFS